MKILLPDKTPRETAAGPMTVRALLLELGLDPIGVIVARNGTLVPEDALLDDSDEVRIIRIAHGG